ncbi:MAG: hypothetical protein D3916_01425 [Candidatus Electrothrix sp. MAN1_4]|nr:hypothetical protein [Candidatus Electrothrix sp. MAN1_4]
MKWKCFLHFFVFLLVAAFLPSVGVGALENGDDRSTVYEPSSAAPGVSSFAATASATGSRTSPFDPPEDDSFVTDSGPGLDTGCTFDDDPEHPLIIDVLIDRAVGPVDSNGYLVNPDPLIAKGIIPSSVEIIMPAYDIDVNGSPPPERDEVAFNGETLGALTGDNGIWKLNSFNVDIRKIKFPAPPAAGSAPTPRANRIKITVDTLSNGRWCMAIDWVAIVIPIKPKVALTLKPADGSNRVRVNDLTSNDAIDVIYQQDADADCNITETIGTINDIDEYPFSGSSDLGNMKIHTNIVACPVGSMSNTPKVEVKWNIADTSLKGTETWSTLEGDTSITMPDKVGAYEVKFNYTVDGEALPEITRKLFVTKSQPLATDSSAFRKVPRLSWYDHATTWASGKQDEDDILESLLAGLYSYGASNWLYGYCRIKPNISLGEWDCSTWSPYVDINYSLGKGKCNWKELSLEPIRCKPTDCYVFSEVFEKMAATLGIGGFSEVAKKGTGDRHFVTKANPSLDPAFPGSAKPFSGGNYDRYYFSSHSLRKRGWWFLSNYYDATFNGIYSSDDTFIAWNRDDNSYIPKRDSDGSYYSTHEGVKIYLQYGRSSYDSWGSFKYKTPPAAPSPAGFSKTTAMATTTQASTELRITDSYSFAPVDDDGNGIFDALVAKIDVEVLTPGFYTVTGMLMKNGKTISDQPAFEHAQPTQVFIGDALGIHTATLVFSGEQIFRSGKNGPYELEVVAIGSDFDAKIVTTPAYDHTLFGERSARIINAAADAPADTDGNGR